MHNADPKEQNNNSYFKLSSSKKKKSTCIRTFDFPLFPCCNACQHIKTLIHSCRSISVVKLSIVTYKDTSLIAWYHEWNGR